MNTIIINSIVGYIKSQARNKIVFYSNVIPQIDLVDLGLRISESIYNIKEHGKLSLIVKNELKEILDSSISHHDLFGRYLSIENLGILFEPELKIDLVRLLDSYSQNNVLFVKWEGDIDTDNIYFLTKENGIKINIRNLSHIAI
jgi:hypothetical protein